jgi:hypothetical protein
MSVLTQHKSATTPASIVESLRIASQLVGRPMPVLLWEMLRLRFGRNRLGASEYFDYNLFHTNQEISEKLQFIGWRRWGAIERLTVPRDWWAVFEDKLTLYAALQGLGFPIPELYAIYQDGRRFGALRSLSSRAELAEFLVGEARYPCFAKPNASGRGVGITLIQRYNSETGMLVLASGKEVSVDSVCSEIDEYFEEGFLFQEALVQEQKLTDRIGPAIGTIRLITAVAGSRPTLLSAAWRIPRGTSVVDNFSQSGNLLAGVNIDDGAVNRVVAGKGLLQKTITSHPDTGADLIGFRIPRWDDVVRLGLSGTAAFPRIRLQAWDIAVAARGPVVIEANIAGDVDVPQVANQCGIGDDRFESLIRQQRAREG